MIRILFSLFFSACISYGQGILSPVTFSNDVDAPARLDTGELLGNGWFGQIYAVPAGEPLLNLKPQFPIKSFRSDLLPGYLYEGREMFVAGSMAGQRYTVVVRVFKGTTYEESLYRGESAPLTIFLSGGLQPPTPLVGLQPITATCIPEPGTLSILLVSLGMVALGGGKRFWRQNAMMSN